MKLGPALGGVLLAMPVLVSCGGDGESGSGKEDGDRPAVSAEVFCSAAEKFENTFTETDTTHLDRAIEALKDAARELEDVGTPAEIPDDAREGLELTLDKLIGLPDDAEESDLMAVLDLTDDERARSTAFEDYLDATCDYRDDSTG
jgi:hypothetical protein